MSPLDVIEGRARWCVVHGDASEALREIPQVAAVITDPPYGIGEAAGKNKSRSNIAVARDYGDASWDDAPPSAELIDLVRSRGLTQVLFGGNYFRLPPARCWLIWDKLNGANDFADCELAWTNLDKAVRLLLRERQRDFDHGLDPVACRCECCQWGRGLEAEADAAFGKEWRP